MLPKLSSLKKIILHAPVYNNAVTTEAFINLTVTYDIKITQGKIIWYKENTGNFILAGMWPPWYTWKILEVFDF